MIVPMRHVTLLCVATEREKALQSLAQSGSVHLNLLNADAEACREAQARLDAAREAHRILEAARAGKPALPHAASPHRAPGHELDVEALLAQPLPDDQALAADPVGAIHALSGLRQALMNEAARLERDLLAYQPFGEFDITLPARLAEAGVKVRFFRAPEKTRFPETRPGALIRIFADGPGFVCGILIGPGELPDACEPVLPPEAPLSVLRQRHDEARRRADDITRRLHSLATRSEALDREMKNRADRCDFVAASESMSASGPVVWIAGWLPAGHPETALRQLAREQGWGLLLRDPLPQEEPPTLMRPPRLFRPVLTLFEALGISPAYREADISVPFFCFFSIFFAMLVGDGGYGALFLGLTLWARRRLPAAPRAPFALLACFSAATIAWGALSNTWFGVQPAFASNPVSAWLNDPERGIANTMLICFTLGVTHLSLARVWNAISSFPDTVWLAQIGWAGILWFMYCMTCQVVGLFPAPRAIYGVFGVSLALVFLFSLKRSELRSRGIELGMMPLTIVGCLGDIISYVRLFAVGLASVRVAQNFNDMAVNLPLPLWARIVPLILILLIGHGLNVLMAGLSVLVHAVRLNTLEFSTHKGVTWAGFPFKPFGARPDAAP